VIDLNPLHLFKRKVQAPPAARFLNSRAHPVQTFQAIHATPEAPATPEGNPMANIFTTIFSWIAKEEKVIYADIIKYAPPVAKIAELLFPGEATAIAAGTSAVLDATTLIQNAVLMVEQKYAASGVATGTGVQKSAEVLTLTSAAVTSLLTSAGVTAPTTAYIQSLVTAVVSILNVQQITVPASTAAPVAAAA
jgi:hypothetical protein